VTLEASVRAGERTAVSHDYVSGTVRVGSFRGDERLDSMVAITDAAGKAVARGRTYTGESSNPKSFVLPPGRYRVEVTPLNPKGLGTKQGEVTLEAGGEDEVSFDFAG
jgi:Ca-activated chloride channel family protein